MSSFLTIDKNIIEEVSCLKDIKDEVRRKLLVISINSLDGQDTITTELKELSNLYEINYSKLNKICSSCSVLMWDCVKLSNKEIESLQAILIHLELPEEVAIVFYEVFYANKSRLLSLKSSLGVSTYSYHNLSWRLDVELARRNLHVINEPKYLLKLDLIDNSNTSSIINNNTTTTNSNSNKYQHHHLQTNYATMKLIQDELQKAMDEMNNTHCQRISKYIL